MTTTSIDVDAIQPLEHREAMELQRRELEITLAALRALDEAAWAAPTDCPAWDVRAMYQHVLGACEAGASLRENARQLWRARARRRAHGGPLEAALSAVQVEERAGLDGPAIVARLSAVAPRTIRGRSRTPGLVRNRFRLAVDGPVTETWRLGYLIDTIYLRDLWMHRVDLCRAAGRTPDLEPDHDGRIVADIVGEWSRRHGSSFELELTGAAGGCFTARRGGHAEQLSLDGVEFCRTLAGRRPGSGLLATIVPF